MFGEKLPIKRTANTDDSTSTSPPKIIKVLPKATSTQTVLQTDDIKLKHATNTTNSKQISITNNPMINLNEPKSFLFPIISDVDFEKLENWIKNDKTRPKVEDVLKTMKSSYPSVTGVFSRVFSDTFLRNYSWNGKNGLNALGTTALGALITKIWKSPNMSLAEFEKSIRVIIFQAHTRNSKIQKR